MKLRIVTTLAALFILGGASGYLAGKPAALTVGKLSSIPPPLPRSPRLDHVFLVWKERLKLTPQQIEGMQPALRAGDEKLRAIQAETAEKIRGLLRENAAALRTRLTAEQSAEFERMTQELLLKQPR